MKQKLDILGYLVDRHELIENVLAGRFVDYDGFAHPLEFNNEDWCYYIDTEVFIYPSEVLKHKYGDLNQWKFYIWYNR